MFQSDVIFLYNKEQKGSLLNPLGKSELIQQMPKAWQYVPHPSFLRSKPVSEVSRQGHCVPRKCFTLRPAVRTATWGPLCLIGMFIFMTSVPEEALFRSRANGGFLFLFPTEKVTWQISHVCLETPTNNRKSIFLFRFLVPRFLEVVTNFTLFYPFCWCLSFLLYLVIMLL